MITKVRSKKLGTKVDLTAMVSVSFLLIIFFMVTNELAKPKIMALGLPDNSGCGHGGCGFGVQDRTMTILLGDNNKLVTYKGLLGFSKQLPKEVKYGKEGIRKDLMAYNKNFIDYSRETGRSNKGAIVIIKPSKKCNYENLVAILDEMNIVGIGTYAIINDFTPEELQLVALK